MKMLESYDEQKPHTYFNWPPCSVIKIWKCHEIRQLKVPLVGSLTFFHIGTEQGGGGQLNKIPYISNPGDRPKDSGQQEHLSRQGWSPPCGNFEVPSSFLPRHPRHGRQGSL